MLVNGANYGKVHIGNSQKLITDRPRFLGGVTLLELVLTDAAVTPQVELLEGPRVRLTISASESLADGIAFCRAELTEAVERALRQLHHDESAPSRVFVRDPEGTQVIATSDPCATYGSQAIVRS